MREQHRRWLQSVQVPPSAPGDRSRPPRRTIPEGSNAGLPVSEILLAAVELPPERRLTFGLLCRILRHRAYGLLVVLLAAPNAVPMPPGTSIVTGVPLLLLAVQMTLGRHRPHLPRALRTRSLPHELVTGLSRRMVPFVRLLERTMRPRLTVMLHPWMVRVIGAVLVLVALVILAPVPLSNLVPSFGASLMALALLQRDGLVLIFGLLVTLAGLGLFAGLVWGLWLAVGHLAEEITAELAATIVSPTP